MMVSKKGLKEKHYRGTANRQQGVFDAMTMTPSHLRLSHNKALEKHRLNLMSGLR